MPRGIHSSPPRLDLVAALPLLWSTSQYEGPRSERPYEGVDNRYICVICGHPRGDHMNAGEHCPRRQPDVVMRPGMGFRTRVPFKRHWKVIPKPLP
jgi:hypothetical protein